MKKNNEKYWDQLNCQFKRQAAWTKSTRNRIYRKIGLKGAKRILEVGCGTGVITKEIREKTSGEMVAIDKDSVLITRVTEQIPKVKFYSENTTNLSMRNDFFDIVFCHYFFLWQTEHLTKTTNELVRVCKKGGYVVALAEPDYGAWIEYPDLGLGDQHIDCLKSQGADPFIGRKLLSIFEQAGLEASLDVTAQVWDQEKLRENIREEWELIVKAGKISQEKFDKIIKKEMKYIENNTRMIFMPVFSITGKKYTR